MSTPIVFTERVAEFSLPIFQISVIAAIAVTVLVMRVTSARIAVGAVPAPPYSRRGKAMMTLGVVAVVGIPVSALIAAMSITTTSGRDMSLDPLREAGYEETLFTDPEATEQWEGSRLNDDLDDSEQVFVTRTGSGEVVRCDLTVAVRAPVEDHSWWTTTYEVSRMLSCGDDR